MAQALVASHDGEVPATMEALTKLSGVGRKTANVVLGHALGVPGLPVDRHVLRVANRIGIAESDDAVIVEEQLCAALPDLRWTRTSDTLILHGRRICRPKPLCESCAVPEHCDYFQLVVNRAGQRRTPAGTPRAGRGSVTRTAKASKSQPRKQRGAATRRARGATKPAKRRK